MPQTGGVGGFKDPSKVGQTSKPEGQKKDAQTVQNFSMPANSSLGQLKKTLIEKCGKEAGTKLYNSFMKSFITQSLNTMASSAKRAQEASKKMREGNS